MLAEPTVELGGQLQGRLNRHRVSPRKDCRHAQFPDKSLGQYAPASLGLRRGRLAAVKPFVGPHGSHDDCIDVLSMAVMQMLLFYQSGQIYGELVTSAELPPEVPLSAPPTGTASRPQR